MIRIQSFDAKRKLCNEESLAFGRGIESEIVARNLSELKVADVFDAYQVALQNYDDSLVGLVKSTLTDEISEANTRRENLFAGISEQIQVAISHFDEERAAAATRLKLIADAYAGWQNCSLQEQIAFTNDFIRELIADAYKADLETLDLTVWVIRLKMANDCCSQLDRMLVSEQSYYRTKDAVITMRSLYEHAYDRLVERLNLRALTYGDDFYAKLFAWWNAYIAQYR